MDTSNTKTNMATKKPRAKALNEKALLVRLTIHKMGTSKKDKAATTSTAAHYKAQESALAVTKQVFDPKHPNILAITQIANEARTFNYQNTLPWRKDGWNLLPSANYTDYATKMRGYVHGFVDAADALQKTYENGLKDGSFERERKRALGNLYVPAEYPTPENLRGAFKMEIETIPIPDEKDFRVDLAEEDIDQLAQDLIEDHKKLEQQAMDELWNRTYTVVQKLRDKCVADRKVKGKGKKQVIKPAIFRDTLVDNVRELCQLLPKLNIKGDDKLDNMAREIERELTQASADELRDDKKLRKQTAEKAEDIMDRMGAYMGSIPTGDEQESDNDEEE